LLHAVQAELHDLIGLNDEEVGILGPEDVSSLGELVTQTWNGHAGRLAHCGKQVHVVLEL
jgi:hypothetical protein